MTEEQKLPAWQDVLGEAEMLVRQKPIFAKYIKGTILENDVPVWIADFAQRAVQRDRARAAALPSSAQPEQVEAQPVARPEPSAQGPAELWLQLHGDCTQQEASESVDYTDDSVTWCWHQIHDTDVRYVRADTTAAPQARMTDERIDAIAKAQDDEGWFTGQLTALEWRAFARDIEAEVRGIALAVQGEPTP